MNGQTARPLRGRRIVVTRASAQAGGLSDRLTALGATVIELPAIEIVPVEPTELDRALGAIETYDWLLFTSANAVDIVFDWMSARGLPVSGVSGPRIGAIGRSTGERIQRRGGVVALVPESFVGEALVDGLIEAGVAGKRVLLPRARVAREVVPERLREAGASVDVAVVYETRQPSMPVADMRRIFDEYADCVTFTSQSAVRHVIEALGTALPEHVLVACIGPVTAMAACDAGMRVDILAAEYSVQGLVAALVSHLGVGNEVEQA